MQICKIREFNNCISSLIPHTIERNNTDLVFELTIEDYKKRILSDDRKISL
jgi:hypothetical protein